MIYKKIGTYGVIIFSFAFFCMYVNIDYLKFGTKITDYEYFLDMMDLGLGYWNQKFFTTIYMVIYLGSLYPFIDKFNPQFFIRASRKSFYYQQIISVIVHTFLYVFLFSFVGIIFLYIFMTNIYMTESLFWIAYIVQFFQQFLYFLLFGFLFLMFYFRFENKTKGLFLTIIISFIQWGIIIFVSYYMWTPLTVINELHLVYAEESYYITINTADLLKIILLYSIILVYLVKKMKQKDFFYVEE